MEVIEILKKASKQVYQNVKNMAGTSAAAGDYGRGAGGDISRKIDIVAEKTVLDFLKKIKFDCIVFGEECGRVELSENPKGFVIMDAIDGSTNAVRGLPFFCCSLAFAKKDSLSSVTEGVVTDLTTGDMYWASKGKGAFMNRQKIHVKRGNPIYKVVGLNISTATKSLTRKMQPILESSNHTRHLGANALEMAFVARGLLDVLIDFRNKIRITDMAAGYLLVKEAGGLIVDEKSKPLESYLGFTSRLSFIAASNKKILNEFLTKMKQSEKKR